MLLEELIQLYEAVGSGHWEATIDSNGVRHWKPDFSIEANNPTIEKVGNKIIIPTHYINFDSRSNINRASEIYNAGYVRFKVFKFSPFDLPAPGRNFSKGVNAEDVIIMRQLMNALKGRSKKDVIDPTVMHELVEKCTSLLSPMLKKQKNIPVNPNYTIITTVPSSSSEIVTQFAESLRNRLNIPYHHTNYEALRKRDIFSVYDDIERSGLSDAKKAGMLQGLDRGLDHMGDNTDFKLKYIKKNREDLARSNINIFEPTGKDLNRPNAIETLIIVDDNMQRGTSFVHAAKTIIEHHNINPKVIVGVAMFNYNL
jgi:hypothetical protein